MNSHDANHESSSGASTADRRTDKRSPVFYRLDITDHANKSYVGYLLDITMEGMRVRCYGDVDMAGVESLHIVFPHWMELGAGLRLFGRFVWTKPAEDDRNEGGFVFDALKGKQNAIIERLIEKVVRAATEDELL